MTQAATQDLRDLYEETERLRLRFEATQPHSQRLSILTKDAARLRRELTLAEVG